MKEDFLQYIWANSLYRSRELTTVSGKNVIILNGGSLNRDAGPDFFNAKIKIDDIILAGNIEIHLSNSDWFQHGHQNDAAYNNVILSVVGYADVSVHNSEGREIETVELEYADNLYDEYLFMTEHHREPGCFRRLELLDKGWFKLSLQGLAVERLERKCADIQKNLEQTHNDWEECFYRLLCKYWSGNVNSEPFYELALRIPYKILLKYADRPFMVEALLFGCSGLLKTAEEDEYVDSLKKECAYLQAKHKLEAMRASQWKFMRVRPDAFPTVRVALLASCLCRFSHLMSGLLDAGSVKEACGLLNVEASAYWTKHYQFGKLSAEKIKRTGDNTKKIILINAVVPFMFMYGKKRGEDKYVEKALDWLENIEAEYNYIVESWKSCGFMFDSALQTQALIQLRKEYCDRHRCMQCRIGREVLSNFVLK